MKVFALAVCACLAVAPAARAEVQFSISNGRVTILAKDATVRQILAEWARVGKTKIVNGERIPGGPITIELKDVPEAEALDVLLRTLSGYIAAPRTSLVTADASLYDSIAVMPTIAAAAPRTTAPAGAPAPFSAPPAFNQNDDDPDAAPGPVRPGGAPPQPGRPPIFTNFPSPQTGNPGGVARPALPPVVRPGAVGQQQNNNPEPVQQPVQAPPAVAAPLTSPGGFVGTSAPGMLPPAASQPGQIVQPARPPGE
jgi:hypothetical protein